MTTRKSTKLVREGRFAAEVTVDLIQDEGDWSPYLSAEDAHKLDDVRRLLRSGDISGASHLGRVFELTPVAV